MIRVNSLKIQLKKNDDKSVELELLKKMRINRNEIIEYSIAKISIDARKKSDVHYVYSIDVKLKNENEYLRKNKDHDIIKHEKNVYCPYPEGVQKLQFINAMHKLAESDSYKRPVIIGSGPAGLFCAYKLASEGLKPILLERGEDVDSRMKSVDDFWQGKPLKPDSNVQFGEGGAGTFSDGKLNTMVKDINGRIGEVYRIFVENGADKSITYINKPHIGTDRLCSIVKNIRNKIISLGGEVRFNSCVTEIKVENQKVSGVVVNNNDLISCDIVVLAIGHSSRDTFEMLHSIGVAMEQKPFAMGVRVQHPQKLINENQYGPASEYLPAADYKLTCNLPNSRSVYSFCMCPGGYVVNASSENGRLCVNGMSYSGRDGESANSAVVVSVGPKDYPGNDELAGMRLQRELEEKAFQAANGSIPVQCYSDFCSGIVSSSAKYKPACKGTWEFSDLNRFLPDYISESIKQAFPEFSKQIKGFDDENTLLMGLESRTSSPVRILRNNDCQSINIRGLYPCGEGAGYAGGITSAAVDGLRIYEAILKEFGGNIC